MLKQKNILVLYTELANYTIKCFSQLALAYDTNIYILRLPVNKSAPFEFNNTNPKIHLYDTNVFNRKKLDDLYNQILPDLIYCAGWTNKLYIDFCKSKNGKCKFLLGFDTAYNGSIRQIIGSLYAKLFISPYFNYAFVPGNGQYRLAIKMGFKTDKIITGAYSADVDSFLQAYSENRKENKVLIFVGRYSHEKGIKILVDTFIELKNKNLLKEWKLWCIGTGNYSIPQHPDIKDLGFKQPNELIEVMKNASVFILPSSFEPWGVVVHEFASAGFPMICSDKVGAAEIFLKDGKNGFLFMSDSKADLIEKIVRICSLPSEIRKNMGAYSYELSKIITPATWAKSIFDIIK